jgi:hypothetical protein
MTSSDSPRNDVPPSRLEVASEASFTGSKSLCTPPLLSGRALGDPDITRHDGAFYSMTVSRTTDLQKLKT